MTVPRIDTHSPPLAGPDLRGTAVKESEAAAAHDRVDRVAAIVFPTLVGLIVRFVPVLGVDFPLNDGGLFAGMIDDLVAGGLTPPAYTSYNGGSIPFAYPPLGLYLGAVVALITGVQTTDVLRVLPALLSTFTIPLVFLVAWRLLGTQFGAAIAATAYALVPRAYDWQVSGGGLTRALGMLLAFAAVYLVLVMRESDSPRRALVVGVLTGLTALSHPSAALFLAITFAVLWLPVAYRTRQMRSLGIAAATAAAIALPWVGFIWLHHGVAPLAAAATSGAGPAVAVANLIALRFTGAAVLDIFIAFAVLGATVSLVRRELLLPVWGGALLLIDARAAGTNAMLPMSLLIAVGVAAVVELAQRRASVPDGASRGEPQAGRGVVVALLGLALTASLLTQLRVANFRALSPDERSAMTWVQSHAASDATVAVVTGEYWSRDSISEWFPVLTGRMSVATAQGYEWTSPDRWRTQIEAHRDLQRCALGTAACLEDWIAVHGQPDLVFISKRGAIGDESAVCCAALAVSLANDPGYELLYDGAGAVIYRVASAP